MPLVTVNGLTAFDALMFTPRFGAWQIDARVDDPAAISGRVTVVAGSRTLSGTAIPGRSGEFVEVAQLRILAGAGGLGVSARPKHYDAPTLGIVLGDLLAAAGEVLSGTADRAVLATELDSWTTSARPIGSVIRELFAVAAPTAAWRMLDDGTVWVGVDAFPDAGIDAATYEVTDRSAEENAISISLDGPLPLVGTTFEGGRVNSVEDAIPHVGKVAARIWFENPTPRGADRLLAALQSVVRGTSPGVDHRFRYWADVIEQSGGTVHGQPENADVPDMGNVPLAAQAGDSVDGVQGGRVLVGWAGDPSQRYAAGFDSAAMPTTRTLAVLEMLFLGGSKGAEPAILGGQLTTYLGLLAAAINALAPGAVPPPPPSLLASKVSVL